MTNTDHVTHERHILASAPWRVITVVAQRMWDDAPITLAGNIAFRTCLSVFPFLIFLTAVAGFFGDTHLAEAAVDYLLAIVPHDLIAPLAPEIHYVLTERRGDLLSLSVLLTIWTASGGVDSIRAALNRAYGVPENRNGAILLLQNVLFVIGGAVILLATAFLIVLAPLIIAFLNTYVPGAEPLTQGYDALRYPLAMAILFAGLVLAHIFLPARWTKLRDIWPGALVTVIIWVFLAGAYAYYLARFAQFASTYAGLAGIMAALFFLYLGAMVLIFGGELNRALYLRREGLELIDRANPGSPPKEDLP